MTDPRIPLALVIMDGYGLAEPGPGNAIAAAQTPELDALFERYPHGRLTASGLAVGLPDGQMGNSEVGHLNIGAGRVVYQELTRICEAVEDGSILENEVLREAVDVAVAEGKAVHFMGLLSDGGVHSHVDHLQALIRLAVQRGSEHIYVHCFLDGRDVPPDSGKDFVKDLETFLLEVGVGEIATVMGRYYAMDRDSRWERVERAWRAMVFGEGMKADSAGAAVDESYSRGVTDEFVEPVVVTRTDGKTAPVAKVSDGDALIFFNFRPDRAREITRAFVDPDFNGFERPAVPDVHLVCLTEYDPTIPAPVAFSKALPTHVLADVLAEEGLRQFHIAETEKYAHVTFFLNGGAEQPKKGEQRVLVPSPRIATYDLKPEMSAFEVTDRLVSAIETGEADVYIVNYANCDMVGHTGVLDAAVAAVEAVDACVGRVVRSVRGRGGVAIVTADHGNAERMLEGDAKSPFTAHTPSDVPFLVVCEEVKDIAEGGILADVAPTVTELLGIESPSEWTGRSLLIY